MQWAGDVLHNQIWHIRHIIQQFVHVLQYCHYKVLTLNTIDIIYNYYYLTINSKMAKHHKMTIDLTLN